MLVMLENPHQSEHNFDRTQPISTGMDPIVINLTSLLCFMRQLASLNISLVGILAALARTMIQTAHENN
jgi:hypothetical protein